MSRSRPESAPPLDYKFSDGRRSVAEVLNSYGHLIFEHQGKKIWELRNVVRQMILNEYGEPMQNRPSLPMIHLCNRIRGRALWLLAGVHGEEPAGVNALADNVPLLEELTAKGIPIVVFPLLSPAAYYRDWRFNGVQRGGDFSITDCDFVLPDLRAAQLQPRMAKPHHPETQLLIRRMLELAQTYPPELVLDLHEDDNHEDGPEVDHDKRPYIYSYGIKHGKPVADEVVRTLLSAGCELQMEGLTRFGERIVGGVVASSYDGSVDEMLTSSRLLVNGEMVPGPNAAAGIVTETRVDNAPLADRVAQQTAVLQNLPRLWEIACQLRDQSAEGLGTQA